MFKYQSHTWLQYNVPYTILYDVERLEHLTPAEFWDKYCDVKSDEYAGNDRLYLDYTKDQFVQLIKQNDTDQNYFWGWGVVKVVLKAQKLRIVKYIEGVSLAENQTSNNNTEFEALWGFRLLLDEMSRTLTDILYHSTDTIMQNNDMLIIKYDYNKSGRGIWQQGDYTVNLPSEHGFFSAKVLDKEKL